VSYDDAWSVLSNTRQLLPNIDSSHIKSGNVSISHLRTYLTIAADRDDDITIFRTFILFMMGHLWFQTANDAVPLGYLAAVADLDEAAQYDWGSAILLQVPNGNREYYLGDRCWRQLIGESHIPLNPPLNMSPHISPAALQEMKQAGFLDYMFGPTTLRAGITPVVVTSASVHSLSQDFSLSSEVEGPDPGWHMEWTGRREILPIASLRDLPPMSSSYGAEELWHLTHRHLDSVDNQLYAHDLHLRKESDVRVVPLPAEGNARMRQRGSGSQTRGGSTTRRGTG
ncbi:hypothetical protein GIB67_024909, partial [Kingdonia uniflora]